MEIFSHILWPMMLFRNRLWREEALFFAILPDISFLFIMMYVLLGTPMDKGWEYAMLHMPDIYRYFYFFMHSFLAVALVAFVIWLVAPKLLPAVSGWVLHIFMDIPMHDGEFSTRFLYPLTDFSVSGLNWTDYRVLPIMYLLFINFTVYALWRERKKFRTGESWGPDWVDRLDAAFHRAYKRMPPQPAFAKNLISKVSVSLANAKEQYIRKPLEKLLGKDEGGAGQGQD